MGVHVGLDIGIASVGWAVVDPERRQILGMGVRTFPRAEDAKTGAPLAEPRRLARSVRRRLARRQQRMEALRELLVRHGLATAEELDGDPASDASLYRVLPGDPTPFELRAAGLDRRLDRREWVRVLTQLCKRRGFKSMRLSRRAEEEREEGVLLQAIEENRRRLEEKGYRTAGEMLARDPEFAEAKRNRRGEYRAVLSRDMVLDEVAKLFDAQRTHGNPFASPELEADYVAILETQAPILEGPDLMCKVGRCSLDGEHPRTPLASPTFERFRLLQHLLTLRIVEGAGAPERRLTPDELRRVLDKAQSRKTALTVKDVRKVLGLLEDAAILGLRSRDDGAESERLPGLPAWHAMREAVSAAAPELWEALAADEELLHRTACVLTYYKTDESVRRELAGLGHRPRVVDALAGLRFSGHAHLSRETILRILPHMEQGLPYDEACEAAGIRHYLRAVPGTRARRLPPLPADDIRNPVVLRALSQARKVLNAIIDRWGPIEALHIELARDVGRSAKERRRIEFEQRRNRERNEQVRAQLKEDYGLAEPRPLEVLKYRLWREQHGRCVYSGEYIEPERMLREPYYTQVDHILPMRRSFDDSYMNKVLVLSEANQEKRDRTPYEWLGGDERRWHEFSERVLALHLPLRKRQRLLRKDFKGKEEEEFRERNLNDTRWAAREFKNFVEANLEFASESARPVIVLSGRVTNYLHKAWRLEKVRSEGDLHHAMDAAVAAVTSPGMVQKVSRFFSARRLTSVDDVYVDAETGEVVDLKHIPEPWEGFVAEVREWLAARFSDDPAGDLAAPDGQPRPILVSRMPRRGLSGEAHKETVRRLEGAATDGRLRTSKVVPLSELDSRSLERMVGRERGDHALYELLRARLEEAGDDPKKAFSEPVYKPSRNGRGPRVKAVRVWDDDASGGVPVRGGLADHGRMVRTDVFERGGRYVLVPVYVADVAARRLPTKAIRVGKPETEWHDVSDGSWRFCFSLYENDFVRIVRRRRDGRQEVVWGYYKGCDRNTARITIEPHDSSRDGAAKPPRVSVYEGIAKFEKYHVDVLGRQLSRVRGEARLGFSRGGGRE